jgi:hypothetical protein
MFGNKLPISCLFIRFRNECLSDATLNKITHTHTVWGPHPIQGFGARALPTFLSDVARKSPATILIRIRDRSQDDDDLPGRDRLECEDCDEGPGGAAARARVHPLRNQVLARADRRPRRREQSHPGRGLRIQIRDFLPIPGLFAGTSCRIWDFLPDPGLLAGSGIFRRNRDFLPDPGLFAGSGTVCRIRDFWPDP